VLPGYKMTEIVLANNVELLCRYIQKYRSNYSGIKATHIGGFKRHYNEVYNLLINEVNGVEITINNITDILVKLFLKINSINIKTYGYILINDIIKKRLSIGGLNINEDDMNALKTLNTQINKSNEKILFENIDKILNEDTETIDSFDIDLLRNEINVIPETQPLVTNSQNVSNMSTSNVTQPNTSPNNTQIINVSSNILANSAAISNISLPIENLKQIFLGAINTQRLCSKQDMNDFIDAKFNEFNSLLITNEMADTYIDTIEELLIKQMRIENDDKILNLHLQAKTAPASLMHTNFPNPLFPDDRNYIDNYNAFITSKQEEWINFNRQQLSIKNDKLNKDILNLKLMVGLKYSDIDNIMLELKEKTNKLLKDEFINANNKMLNVINKKYEVRVTTKNQNNINKRNGKKRKSNNFNNNSSTTHNKSNTIENTQSNTENLTNNNHEIKHNTKDSNNIYHKYQKRNNYNKNYNYNQRNTNNYNNNNTNNYSTHNTNQSNYNRSNTTHANIQNDNSLENFPWRNPSNKTT